MTTHRVHKNKQFYQVQNEGLLKDDGSIIAALLDNDGNLPSHGALIEIIQAARNVLYSFSPEEIEFENLKTEACRAIKECRSQNGEPGFVYLLQSPTRIKVGMSKQPRQRALQVSRKEQELFKLVAFAHVPDSKAAESWVHSKLEQHSLGDEFFEKTGKRLALECLECLRHAVESLESEVEA